MNVAVVAWWAAVRLAEHFHPTTPEERDDIIAVLRENRRLLDEGVLGAADTSSQPKSAPTQGAPT